MDMYCPVGLVCHSAKVWAADVSMQLEVWLGWQCKSDLSHEASWQLLA